jgi:hypothetical protein
VVAALHTDCVISTRAHLAVAAFVSLSLLAASPVAADTRDDGDEVRATGACGSGVRSTLRLKADDDKIELRFKVERARSGSSWRVVVVQERRVAWRGDAKARQNGSFEIRRTLRDLSGADAVSVRAVGPGGLVCRASATLPD